MQSNHILSKNQSGSDLPLNLETYGIFNTAEIIRNPSYELLYAEETAEHLKGIRKRFSDRIGRYIGGYRRIHRSIAQG